MNALVVGVGPLHGQLERHVLFFGLRLERNDFLVNQFGLLRRVQELDVVHQAALIEVGVFFTAALILDADLETLVQEAHLLKACAQGFVVEVDGFENLGVRFELDHGSGRVGGAGLRYWGVWHTALVALGPEEPFAGDGHAQLG